MQMSVMRVPLALLAPASKTSPAYYAAGEEEVLAAGYVSKCIKENNSTEAQGHSPDKDTTQREPEGLD